MTALHQSLKHWGGLLRYAETEIEVDNKALSYLLTKDESLRSPREWRLAEFLTGFDITLKHIPGVTNSRPDFLSRLPGTALGPAVILDLAAGCGSTLRALAILARKGLIRSDKQLVQYVAVESNPTARAAIKKMYESVSREFPRLFVTIETGALFPLGHDVRSIADNARVRKKPFRVDLLLASPPCQPFSRANPRAKGMADDRELFTPVADIIHLLLATNPQMKWCCENVEFGKEEGERAPFPVLRKARAQVDALFASLPGTRSVTYDMSRFVSQKTTRTFWTNIPEAHEASLPEEGAAGSYADLLQRIGRGKPVRENRFAATNMAWSKSKLHQEGLNDYVDQKGTRKKASEDWELQEALSGLDPGDTDVQIKDEQIADGDRQRLLGNVWVPPCMAHWIQAAWARKAIITEGEDPKNILLIQAGAGIQPLTGFSGTITDFLNRLQRAMEAEPAFTASCETAVGGGKVVVARTVDGVKLFKDEKGRWKIPEGASAPARELRHAIMQSVHEWGHRGGQACLDVLKEVVTWTGMAAAVKDYAASCPRCQISKNNRARRADALRPTPIPTKAGVSVRMDLVELPAVRGRWAGQEVTCDMLLVVRDRMSKLVKLIPTKKEGLTSENLANIFETEILSTWPSLEEVYSDRDQRYVGRAFQLLMKKQGLKAKKTVAYRPQSDGASERAIQTVLETLRGELAPVEDSSNRSPRVEVPIWLELISTVERVMNSYPHSSTGVSPYKLATGHEPKHPFHELVREREPAGDELEYLERQARILERAYTVAFRTMEARQEAMRRRYEPNTSPPLQVGQRVLVRAQRRGVAEKLSTRAYGPLEVLEARHPVYKLQRDGPGQTHTFNRDQLIPYRESGDGTDSVPMPQILESPTALVRRRGPAQVHRVDWAHGAKVPPTYIVSWRHGGPHREVHEDELVSAYTPEGEVADAFKAYLLRRKFAELTHENVPEEGMHERYQAYRSHYDLMVDTSRGALVPQYEPSGNTATSPGGWVLTAECRARAAYLRNRGAEASEPVSEEEEGYATNEQVTREELVRQREELLRQTRERAAELAAEVTESESEGELEPLQ